MRKLHTMATVSRPIVHGMRRVIWSPTLEGKYVIEGPKLNVAEFWR